MTDAGPGGEARRHADAERLIDAAEPPESGSDPGPMADVIDGPIGSARLVDPAAIPEREATLPELGVDVSSER